MDEPTPVDPMSDDRVNAESILRPIEGSGGWEFEKPDGRASVTAARHQSEACRAARLNLTNWSGKLAAGGETT